MKTLIRLLWGLAVLGFVTYLVFFVRLGEKTAFEHVARIWKTDEAKELRDEVGEASRRLGKEIKEQIQSAQADDKTK